MKTHLFGKTIAERCVLFMNRKTKILFASYGAAAMFAAGGMVFANAGGIEGYRISQDNEYRRAMAQLVSSVSQADAALEKGAVATGSGMTGKVCAELMSAAQSANTALSILPLDTYALEEVSGFFSQLEEYARVKGARACEGDGFDNADREMSEALQQVTGGLVPVLEQLYMQVSEQALPIRGLMHEQGMLNGEEDRYLEDEILSMLESFPETPTLVYAGKLSADYDDSYAAVKGLKTVTEQQAKSVADKLAGVESEFAGLSGGKLPSYYFGAETEHGALTVAITEQGGLALLYLLDYVPGEATVSESEAKRTAQAFLELAGYSSLREMDSVQENGLLKLTYVYADGAGHLAQSITVSVAMDIAKVVSMDASEYLRHHGNGESAPPRPKLTATEAREIAVPTGTKVLKEYLTWYTGDTGTTTLCWRFTCQGADGQTILIYADSATGKQVEITLGKETVSEM